MNTTANPAEDCQTIVCNTRTSNIHRTTEERLRGNGYLALRDVACMARDDVVYLHGHLPSYFLKQIAQEIAAGVEGVRRVINRIDVLRPARPGARRPG
jgi:osmotically-inducible protein OsmY